MTGGITYGIAIPIIMGQNIGTCVTALLSCIGATKNARRTAMVHLYFNLLGTFVFLALFYILNGILHFSFLDDVLDPAHIAIIHTSFNVLATAMLLPLSNVLVRLATISIKEKPGKEEVAARRALPRHALVRAGTVPKRDWAHGDALARHAADGA
ncbi:MAG: Na/Pi symporter [Eubacteriales bacterium]